MTAPLEGDEWSAARPGRTLSPGKTRYPFYRRLCGPQGRSGRAENLANTGIRSRTVQPVDSRYTDWLPRPTKWTLCNINTEWTSWLNTLTLETKIMHESLRKSSEAVRKFATEQTKGGMQNGSVHCKREIFFPSPRLTLLLGPPSLTCSGAVLPGTEWSKFEV